MQRYLLTIAYHGKHFLGWQRQSSDNAPISSSTSSSSLRKSVQATLEQAIFQFYGQKATLCAAGRTDQGVHALGQRAHIDLDLSRFETAGRTQATLLRDALNAHLKPFPVVVKAAQPVASTLHARFSAINRSYLYRIVVSPTRPVLREDFVWHRVLRQSSRQRWGADLEAGLERMQASAQDLLGEHDFAAFRSSACQARSSIKRMHKAEITRLDDELRLVFCASGFLYRQVRLMAGTLLALAEQRLPVDTVRRLLSGDTPSVSSSPASSLTQARRFAAPARGLHFVGATYPDDLL